MVKKFSKVGKYIYKGMMVDYFSSFESGSLRELLRQYWKCRRNELIYRAYWEIRIISIILVLKERKKNALF